MMGLLNRYKVVVMTLLIASLPLYLLFAYKSTKEIIIECAEGEDMTYVLRQAIEQAAEYDCVKIILTEGIYHISPTKSIERYIPITNHGNGSKHIAFAFSGHKSVEIEGQDAKLIFHGQMLPFLFEECDLVRVSGITIDWDTPYTFLAEVIAIDPNGEWREVKPKGSEEGFSWNLKGGKINFPNIDGFNYDCLGSTLAFDKESKRPIVGALDLHSDPLSVEQLPNGNLKIYERLRQMPPVGSLLSSKGDRKSDRYAPAFNFKESKNILLNDITIHHALGMGFLFERSENITIKNSQIILAPGSQRVISTTADATHFANCRGDIIIEGCRFENMLDDGTNVHGTYVVVSDIIDDYTLLAELQHFEQLGFKFADIDDELWIIQSPSPSRATTAVVESCTQLNEKLMQIRFNKPIVKRLKRGDLLENKTWNPTFTMKDCVIQNHRARSIVLKTPLQTIIKDNYFSSMMSGVLLRGESKFWYESGAVEDLLIEGNTFHNGADCGTKHAALYVTPLLGETFSSTESYDRNIRFINNVIDAFNPSVVIADRVDGLVVEGNNIVCNIEQEASFPNAPIFELINCDNSRIENNNYLGKSLNIGEDIKADAHSRRTLIFKNNKYEELEK